MLHGKRWGAFYARDELLQMMREKVNVDIRFENWSYLSIGGAMVFKIEEDKKELLLYNLRPIFSVINEVIFCVNTMDKNWVKITPDGQESFKDGLYDMTLLTLLELSLKDLKLNIERALNEKKIDKSFLILFPFKLIVLSGLKSGSEYWICLALDWIKSEKTLVNDEILSLLEIIQSDKDYSQKVRHETLKII